MFMSDGSQEGFTLVELLVSLAVTAMIATVAIGGLMLALRSYAAAGKNDIHMASSAGITRLSSLISGAVPATTLDPEAGLVRLLFDGQEQQLDFVTLSEGFAMEGGLVRARLTLNCGELLVDRCHLELRTSVYRSDPNVIGIGEPVTLARNVKRFSLRYFGANKSNPPLDWHTEWLQHDQLPLAAELNVEIEEDRSLHSVFLAVPLRHAAL
jgi:prepilin-type N-terminal cleavage/methylation domain-containing protein